MPRREPGSLETAILKQLWGAVGPLTSSGVRAGFAEPVRPALTTILTVLERLEGKGLIARTPARGGATFVATRSESEVVAAAMARTLARTGDRASALMRFAGELDDADLVALRKVIGQERS